MTNEELDKARAEEAWSDHYKGDGRDPTVIAARLAREGWTPPEPVDPDLNMARDYAHYLLGTIFEVPSFQRAQDYFLQAIKQGRALAAAEAKPGLVWVKHDGKGLWPVRSHQSVCVKYSSGAFVADRAANIDWRVITHYAEIIPPEDVA